MIVVSGYECGDEEKGAEFYRTKCGRELRWNGLCFRDEDGKEVSCSELRLSTDFRQEAGGLALRGVWWMLG